LPKAAGEREDVVRKFIIEPDFRLQEWIVNERGYFTAEGLRLPLSRADPSSITIGDQGIATA
jgi:hypothetical protein